MLLYWNAYRNSLWSLLLFLYSLHSLQLIAKQLVYPFLYQKMISHRFLITCKFTKLRPQYLNLSSFLTPVTLKYLLIFYIPLLPTSPKLASFLSICEWFHSPKFVLGPLRFSICTLSGTSYQDLTITSTRMTTICPISWSIFATFCYLSITWLYFGRPQNYFPSLSCFQSSSNFIF